MRKTKALKGKRGSKKWCPIVEVKWRDAAAGSNWIAGAAIDPEPCTAVGYLTERTRNKIVLIQCFAKDGDTLGRLAIPAPWVTEVRVAGHSREVSREGK